jgi:hypothetical protein
VTQKFRMQHGTVVIRHCGTRAHAVAPLRIWATWMNLIGRPMRSAQPR